MQAPADTPCQCDSHRLLLQERERNARLLEANGILRTTVTETMEKYRQLALEYAAKQNSFDENARQLGIKESMKNATLSIRNLSARVQERETEIDTLRAALREKTEQVAQLTDDNEGLVSAVESLSQRMETTMVENIQLKRQAQVRALVTPAAASLSPTPRPSASGASNYSSSVPRGMDGVDDAFSPNRHRLQTLASLQPMMEMVSKLEQLSVSTRPSLADGFTTGDVPTLRLMCAVFPSQTKTLAVLRDAQLAVKDIDTIDVLSRGERSTEIVSRIGTPAQQVDSLRKLEEQSRLMAEYTRNLQSESPSRRTDSFAHLAGVQGRLAKIADRNATLRGKLLHMTVDAEQRAWIPEAETDYWSKQAFSAAASLLNSSSNAAVGREQSAPQRIGASFH